MPTGVAVLGNLRRDTGATKVIRQLPEVMAFEYEAEPVIAQPGQIIIRLAGYTNPGAMTGIHSNKADSPHIAKN